MLDENVAPSNKASKAKAKGGSKSIEETYTKKSQLEHILLRPDTYGEYSPHSLIYAVSLPYVHPLDIN